MFLLPFSLLLTLCGAAIVSDTRSEPAFASPSDWGGTGFPVGYFREGGKTSPACTYAIGRFLTQPTWTGVTTGEASVTLVELSTQSALPSAPPGFASCSLSLSLQTWDDSGSSVGTPVGNPVEYLINGTTQGLFSPASIPIPYSAGWALQPSRYYGLALKGLDSCGSLPASERFLRLALSNLSSAVLWPYQGAPDVGCPSGGFSSSTPLAGATWSMALSTRSALVLRGSEASPAFPGSTSAALPLNPGSPMAVQLLWENTALDLTLVQLVLSLYGSSGSPGVTSFNATLRVNLCYVDAGGSNSCIGSAGLPTVTRTVTAVIPGGGAPPRATTFELPSGFTRQPGSRSALQLSLDSLVASDGSSGSGNTCSLLTCGVSGGATDPALSATFLVDTFTVDGSNFFPNYPAGTGPAVAFPCMAVRVVPSDPAAAFPSLPPSPSLSPSPSPTWSESPSSSPSPSLTLSTSDTPTTSATVAASPVPSSAAGGSGTPSASPTPSPTASPTATLSGTPSAGGGGGAGSLTGTPSPAVLTLSGTATATPSLTASATNGTATGRGPAAAAAPITLSSGATAAVTVSMLLLAAMAAAACMTTAQRSVMLTCLGRVVGKKTYQVTRRNTTPSRRTGSVASHSDFELSSSASVISDNPMVRPGAAEGEQWRGSGV
jgi:hypothetical protein